MGKNGEQKGLGIGDLGFNFKCSVLTQLKRWLLSKDWKWGSCLADYLGVGAYRPEWTPVWRLCGCNVPYLTKEVGMNEGVNEVEKDRGEWYVCVCEIV